MKWPVALVLSGLVGLANAQGIDFKGSKFGDSTEQFMAAQQGFRCMRGSQPCELMAVFAPEGRDDMLITYAGEPVRSISASFKADRLQQVSIRIKPESAETIVTTLSKRYGKPTKVSRSEAQTKAGAKFSQVITMWRRKDGDIDVLRYGATIDAGYVTLSSPEWLADAKERAKQDEKKASDDL